MLFAAGFGRRMLPLTRHRPKPLIKVAGKALIDHALDLAHTACIHQIVVNSHYMAPMIHQHLLGKPVRLSLESPDILDTGGGLRAALPQLGPEPVLTLNTDVVWCGPNPLAMLQAHWNPIYMDALLLCIPTGQASGYKGKGDFRSAPDGQLTRGTGLIYSGSQMLKTTDLHTITQRAFSLNLLWNMMREHDRLYGLVYPGKWCDVGRPESIALAEDMLRSTDV
jgi:N-acetyl-alpha-D-muramate 1-phosphate uridylyltransferase